MLIDMNVRILNNVMESFFVEWKYLLKYHEQNCVKIYDVFIDGNTIQSLVDNKFYRYDRISL